MKDNRYRSRKFIAAIIVIVLASIFLAFGKLGGPEWVAAVELGLGIYVVGNVVQKRGGDGN